MVLLEAWNIYTWRNLYIRALLYSTLPYTETKADDTGKKFGEQ